MNFKISSKEYETELNWNEANFYCSMLDINGFGWRLPNKDELNEIYLMENDFEERLYWTSTDYDNYAWGQNFYSGRQGNFTKNYSFYVRAIRLIKIDI